MSDIMKVPLLRFKEFSGDWEEKKLGDIFKISAGGDIKIENVNNIKTNEFKFPIYANAKKNKGFYGYSNIYKIDENVITVAGRGVNIGIAHIRKQKFYPIVRLLVLKPNKEVDIDFFEYQINQINIFIESTGVPQLTAPQISIYTISYPLTKEQQKIASFLTSIDTKIEQLTKKEKLLSTYKKGVMQKIFNQDIRFEG
ncbi:MAG: restriction endonuclease subunit S [Sulfurovum sp.]|nr:restriction endonuclease subunit S [Sulfurovum sp.]